jgi:hypothetical protein
MLYVTTTSSSSSSNGRASWRCHPSLLNAPLVLLLLAED